MRLLVEREVVSVANLTRDDAREFFAIVPQAGIGTQTARYPLAKANEALADLRAGRRGRARSVSGSGRRSTFGSFPGVRHGRTCSGHSRLASKDPAKKGVDARNKAGHD